MNNEKAVYWTRLEHEQWQLYIAATTEGLCYVGPHDREFDELETWVQKCLPNALLIENRSKLHPYADEIIHYLTGDLTTFTCLLDLHGTPFQLSVWQALQQITYGETVSYTDIAVKIEKPSAVRAVGTAIGKNPILIIVPCHRVLAKSGALAGFRGGLDMKQQLLRLEQ